MKISMVLIARDEAANVEPCLASFWDDVDEIIFCDTGSTDGTVTRAVTYAESRGDFKNKLKVQHFAWCDDFAAARNYADSFATGDWLAWADLDDTVYGMAALRGMAEKASPEVAAFFCCYEYAVTEEGVCQCELWRERLVRRGAGKWMDPIHEAQMLEGITVRVNRESARWVHRKLPVPTDRNHAILKDWLEREPQNPRALVQIARDRMAHAENGESIEYYERLLALGAHVVPAETRAQAMRHKAQVHIVRGEIDAAYGLGLAAFGESPAWPDSYLTLAEVAHERRQWLAVLEFANQVLSRGLPETLLILNPLDYTVKPRTLIGSALAELGRLDEACQVAEQALELAPGLPGLAETLGSWQYQRRTKQAAGMWAQCAQILCMAEEPEKAWTLLETLPWYAIDEPEVIAARLGARRLLDVEPLAEPLEDAALAFVERALEPMELAA